MNVGAIDIGGTFIKYGVTNEKGEVEHLGKVPTEAKQGGPHIVKIIIQVAHTIQKTYTLNGIAISTAGQVDAVKGKIVHATDNIPHYKGIELKREMEENTGLPVSVENDVNCTAIGESWMGVAQNNDEFICVTLGTGIGGAIFSNGAIYHGHSNAAGEVGHIPIVPKGINCTCGLQGCFEQYASTKALETKAKEHYGEQMDTESFFELVYDEKNDAILIFQNWLEYLVTGLVTICHTLNPSLIVIGGGISAQGEFLSNAIENKLYNRLLPNHRMNLSVVCATRKNDANLLGATKHFLDQHFN